MQFGNSIRAAVAQAVVLLACAVNATSATAAPAFAPPVDVAPGDQQALTPSAAYDAAGTVTVGWATLSGELALLSSARRPLGGAFAAGPAIAASADDELDAVQLAAGPTGQIAAAWVVGDAGSGLGRIVAAELGPTGEVLGAVPVSAAGDDASEPAIAVGPDGRVAIAWTVTDEDSGDGTVQAAHGLLGLPLLVRSVSAADANALDPDVAVGPDGAMHVAYTLLAGAGADRIRVAAETPAGTFGPPRSVSPASVDAGDAAIAAAAGGGLAIAWTEQAGESGGVKVGVEPAPGAPFTAVAVPGGGSSSSARLADEPAAGGITVAWIRSLNGADSALTATFAGGAYGAVQVVSGTDTVSDIDLASSPAGDAALVWRGEAGTPSEPAGFLRAVLFDAPRAPPPTLLPAPPPTPLPAPPSADAPTPPPPPPPPAPGGPALTSFAVDPTCIRVGTPGGAPMRLSFGFVLSERAAVRLTVQRRLNSRPQRRCPSRRSRGAAGRLGRPIVIDLAREAGAGAVVVGDEGETIARAAHAPRRVLTVTRRASLGLRRMVLRELPPLAPGTYVATMSATTHDGRQSATSKVKFWVLTSSR